MSACAPHVGKFPLKGIERAVWQPSMHSAACEVTCLHAKSACQLALKESASTSTVCPNAQPPSSLFFPSPRLFRYPGTMHDGLRSVKWMLFVSSMGVGGFGSHPWGHRLLHMTVQWAASPACHE